MATSDVRIVLSAEDRTRSVIAAATARLGDLTNVSTLASRSLAGLGASLSVGAITAWVTATVNGIDALNDLADATGSSVENISALEDTARRTGTSFDTVGGALVKFNQALGNAKPGSDAEQALKALGLSVQDLKAQDPAQALLATAVALQGFADDGNKARITQELFGKSLREVAPLLKDLAENGMRAGTVSTAAAQEAEKFNKEMSALGKNALDASRSLALYFIPKINETIELYRQGAKEGKNFYQVMIDEQLRLLGLKDGPKEYAKRLNDINKELDTGIMHESRRNALMRERAAIMAKLPNTPLADMDLGATPNKPSAPDLAAVGGRSSAAAAAARAAKTAREKEHEERIKLGRQLAMQQGDELERSNAEFRKQEDQISAERMRLGRARAIEEGMAVQDENDRLAEDAKKAELKHFEDSFGALVKQGEDKQRRLQSLYDAGPSATLAKQREDVALLTAELEAGRISEAQYLEAVSTRLDLVAPKLSESASLADQLGLSFSSAFEDAIVSGKDFGQVLQGLEQDIIRIAARKLITEPVGNFIASGISGFLGGLSFAGGGYTGSGARSGGLDGMGGFMAMVHPNETIIDHSAPGSAASPAPVVNVVQNFTVGDVASVSLVRQAVAGSERRIAASLSRSMNYGGAVA
jgi:hypothetical protein